MTLELALEKTYRDIAAANETELPAAQFYFAHLTTQLEQEHHIEKEQLPNVMLTASLNQEIIPNSGVFQIELRIDATDAAVRESGISEKLDELFESICRPLLYKQLPAMMTTAGAAYGMKCFGLPERGEGTTITYGEGTVMLSKTALFICSQPPLVPVAVEDDALVIVMDDADMAVTSDPI